MNVDSKALKKRLYQDNAVKNIKFFPGTSNDASPEEYAREVNKFFADANDDKKIDLDEELDN